MAWSYRVVRRTEEGETTYAIHEAYYTDDKVTSITADDIGLLSESAVGLALSLPAYLKALTEPVIDFATLADVEPPVSAQAMKTN
jgi:hypothetical protein